MSKVKIKCDNSNVGIYIYIYRIDMFEYIYITGKKASVCDAEENEQFSM